MRCYRCGSVLSDSNLCNGCGADVKIYKRIIKLSNTYYNMGLEKAKGLGMKMETFKAPTEETMAQLQEILGERCVR